MTRSSRAFSRFLACVFVCNFFIFFSLLLEMEKSLREIRLSCCVVWCWIEGDETEPAVLAIRILFDEVVFVCEKNPAIAVQQTVGVCCETTRR